MKEQKITFTIRLNDDKEEVNMAFEPEIATTDKSWDALPEDEVRLQHSAIVIANKIVESLAMNREVKEEDKDE